MVLTTLATSLPSIFATSPFNILHSSPWRLATLHSIQTTSATVTVMFTDSTTEIWLQLDIGTSNGMGFSPSLVQCFPAILENLGATFCGDCSDMARGYTTAFAYSLAFLNGDYWAFKHSTGISLHHEHSIVAYRLQRAQQRSDKMARLS